MLVYEDINVELDTIEVILQQDVPEAIIKLFENKTPLAWIGSGLSRIAAEMGAILSRNALKCAATRFTPLEYCNMMGSPYQPVLITYSGSSLDIFSVVEHFNTQKIDNVILLTGKKDTKAESILQDCGICVNLFTVPTHTKERRFVALIPFFALCALSHRLTRAKDEGKILLNMFTESRHQAELIRERVRKQLLEIKDWRDRRWIILAGGLSMVGALSWQVLFSEASLLDMMVVDIKDYTHGRYNSAFQRQDMGFIVLSDKITENLATILSSRFMKFYPTLYIHAAGSSQESMWTHIILAGSLVGDLCRVSGWNLTSPPQPSIVKNWNNWGKIRPYESF